MTPQPARPPATAHCGDGRDGLRRGQPRITPAHPHSELNVQYVGDNSRDRHRAGASEPVRLASHEGALEISAARRAAGARRARNSPGRQEGTTHRHDHNAQGVRAAATRAHRGPLPAPQRHCHRRAGDDFSGTCRHGLLPSLVGPGPGAQSTVLRPQAVLMRIPMGVFLIVIGIRARFGKFSRLDNRPQALRRVAQRESCDQPPGRPEALPRGEAPAIASAPVPRSR